MEVTTQEEVHLLVLFDTLAQCLEFQNLVYEHLPSDENDEETFGYQLVVNEHDEILAFNKRLLIGAADLSIEEVTDKVHALNGLVIPSHIDREHFSIISQLGFIPDHVEFDALELSANITLEEANARFSTYHHLPWLFSSDAHNLETIGTRTTRFLMPSPTIKSLRQALRAGGERIMLL
jgi:PHP family Zn ribbon phosphoesterase